MNFSRGLWVIAIPTGCPTEPDGKTMLRKKQLTLVGGHRETKMELSRKLSPCWVLFFQQGDRQVTGEEKPQWFYPAVENVCYKCYPASQNVAGYKSDMTMLGQPITSQMYL